MTEEPENNDPRLSGHAKFWLLFWCLILGSCTVTSFANRDTPFFLITNGCEKK